jgi:hypothetical protein
MTKKITVIAILALLMAIGMTQTVRADGNLPEPRPHVIDGPNP